jgi:hypothetical protein
VNSGPQLVLPDSEPGRNWLPPVVAAAVVIALLSATILFHKHNGGSPAATPISAATDPYAARLPIGNLSMSESSNLAGGKFTYLDGHIANQGGRTVTGVTVQVLFRDGFHEIAWNVTERLRLIRVRDPYVDLEPVSAAPLKPGDGHDFRLVFDSVPEQWNGSYPEIRIVSVATR